MMTRIVLRGFRLGILLSLATCCQGASADELTAGAEEDSTGSETVSSGWIKSKDGSVIFRLLGRAVAIDKTEPIVVFAEICNNTKKTISLLKPFGDDYLARCVNVQLTGPMGRVRHEVVRYEYALGSGAFVSLAPGETFRDRLELRIAEFPGSKLGGDYKIGYTYTFNQSYRDRAKALKFKNILPEDKIEYPAITVKKRSGVSSTKKVSSGWVKSKDGSVSLRLLSNAQPIDKTEPIGVYGEIRNNTKKTIILLKPFGDNYVALLNMQLTGPKGRVRHNLTSQQRGSLGSGAFVSLAPGKTFRDRLEMSVPQFPDSKEAGDYQLVFTYHMTNRHHVRAKQLERKRISADQSPESHPDRAKQPKLKNIIWSGGKIQLPSITIRKR